MLENTFIHVPGIGAVTERRLWDRGIADWDGFEAVRLWQAHLRGSDSALEKLVRYNIADIVNLEPLMVKGFHEMRRKVLPVYAW